MKSLSVAEKLAHTLAVGCLCASTLHAVGITQSRIAYSKAEARVDGRMLPKPRVRVVNEAVLVTMSIPPQAVLSEGRIEINDVRESISPDEKALPTSLVVTFGECALDHAGATPRAEAYDVVGLPITIEEEIVLGTDDAEPLRTTYSASSTYARFSKQSYDDGTVEWTGEFAFQTAKTDDVKPKRYSVTLMGKDMVVQPVTVVSE